MPARAYGGTVESLYRLCLNLARIGCDVRALATNSNGLGKSLDVQTGKEVAVAAGFEVTYSGRIARHSISPGLLLRLPFEIRRADVVHLTGVYWFTTIPTLLACRVLGKPLVWSPRGELQRWRGSRGRIPKRIWEMACRLAAPRSTMLHVGSEAERDAGRSRFPNFVSTVIPNAVRAPANFKRAASDGTLRLGYIGRLHPKKGIENLLEACRILKDQGAAFSLVIAGSGRKRYTQSLTRQITQSGLRDHVRMVGEIHGSAKREFFESIDVLVVPSHGESFASAVAEALAYTVPVVASRGTPWSRLPEKGCGLWVDNAPGSLAQAIVEICTMPLEEMGLRGREWMTAEFSWDTVAREVCNTYSAIINGAPVIGDTESANASITSSARRTSSPN
jgi:glycosyltransferase involved in cell wall biosynthesis